MAQRPPKEIADEIMKLEIHDFTGEKNSFEEYCRVLKRYADQLAEDRTKKAGTDVDKDDEVSYRIIEYGDVFVLLPGIIQNIQLSTPLQATEKKHLERTKCAFGAVADEQGISERGAIESAWDIDFANNLAKLKLHAITSGVPNHKMDKFREAHTRQEVERLGQEAVLDRMEQEILLLSHRDAGGHRAEADVLTTKLIPLLEELNRSLGIPTQQPPAVSQ